MDLARYVVDAVVLERRSVREVARSHGISKSWVAELVRRYREGGDEALKPRSRRPRRQPNRTSILVEDEIVAERKRLVDEGLEAGAVTIAWHLCERGITPPSVATIWRVLTRRGFVVPQPQKRPHASYVRFEATLPNECWQADTTHWRLANGRDVEILNIVDDHSRLCVASVAKVTFKAHDVVAVFEEAMGRLGMPASVLTDNAAIFNGAPRKGTTAFQTLLVDRSITYKHSRPYHPQTCGKCERFHQTLKRWLGKRPPASSVPALQRQLDRFVAVYNEERPHKARRTTPARAFVARDRAVPGDAVAPTHFRVRTDRVDQQGGVTLRVDSVLRHIKVGRAHKGKRIRLYVADLDVRILTLDGELLRHLTIDPTSRYQGLDREVR